MEMEILRRQGCSLREIACESGVAVNTVRKYLAEGGPPSYGPRAPRGSKLDPYKGYLSSRVEAARPHWIPATVLCREIREQGFGGCERLVSGFVRTLKPVGGEEPLVRFETAPGQQLQVDWIEFKREGLSAFVATLGYSRASYVEYVVDERIETLIACHIGAFEFFGGVVREVLYDNMKTVSTSL
jgi:transposase